jgi:hypothetical protein
MNTFSSSLLYALFLIQPFTYGQPNLVQNPGFELGQNNWSDIKTVDYHFGNMADFEGEVSPHSGNLFIGLRLYHTTTYQYDHNWQEYVYQQLPAGAMQAGTTYKISFYYTLGDAVLHTTDDFGIAFFEDPDLPTGAEEKFRAKAAQVRNTEGNFITNYQSWEIFTGFYTATGNETYFGLGAFKVDSTLTQVPISTNYYIHYDELMMFFDDLSIQACTGAPQSAIQDQLLCEPTPILLDATNTGATYLWNTGETAASILAGETETTYWVDITRNGCTIRDSVRIDLFSKSAPLADRMICSIEEFPVQETILRESGESVLWSNGETFTTCALTYPGTYWVQKTQGNCLWTDTVTISSFDQEVYLYPNPIAYNSLTFENESEITVHKIMTSDGKMVWNTSIMASELDPVIIGLSPAVYFIQYYGYGCYKQSKFEVITR